MAHCAPGHENCAAEGSTLVPAARCRPLISDCLETGRMLRFAEVPVAYGYGQLSSAKGDAGLLGRPIVAVVVRLCRWSASARPLSRTVVIHRAIRTRYAAVRTWAVNAISRDEQRTLTAQSEGLSYPCSRSTCRTRVRRSTASGGSFRPPVQEPVRSTIVPLGNVSSAQRSSTTRPRAVTRAERHS